jgi:hypothetical protein
LSSRQILRTILAFLVQVHCLQRLIDLTFPQAPWHFHNFQWQTHIIRHAFIALNKETLENKTYFSRAEVEELLFNYNKQEGATLIIVTHDVDLAKKCDYQILIKDGKIKGSNIPKEGKSGR